MVEAYGEAEIAVSLMKEALTLLDAPEAAPAAQLLRQAIEAATEMAATTSPTEASQASESNPIDGD